MTETPFIPWNPRASDNEEYRVRTYARKRAEKNGVDPDVAAEVAVLRLPACRTIEEAVTYAAGPMRRDLP